MLAKLVGQKGVQRLRKGVQRRKEKLLACGWRAGKGACLALSTRGHLAPGNEG